MSLLNPNISSATFPNTKLSSTSASPKPLSISGVSNIVARLLKSAKKAKLNINEKDKAIADLNFTELAQNFIKKYNECKKDNVELSAIYCHLFDNLIEETTTVDQLAKKLSDSLKEFEFISYKEFLKQKPDPSRKSIYNPESTVLLGLSQNNISENNTLLGETTYQTIKRLFNLKGFSDFYKKFGIWDIDQGTKGQADTANFIPKIFENQFTNIFLLPPKDLRFPSATTNEILWILANKEKTKGKVVFVFGMYDFVLERLRAKYKNLNQPPEHLTMSMLSELNNPETFAKLIK